MKVWYFIIVIYFKSRAFKCYIFVQNNSKDLILHCDALFFQTIVMWCTTQTATIYYTKIEKENTCASTHTYQLLEVTPRRHSMTVATRLRLCIFNKIDCATVASRLWLCIFIKRGNSTSRFATVTLHIYETGLQYQWLRDCDSAYLTKWGNSRFATVTLHI